MTTIGDIAHRIFGWAGLTVSVARPVRDPVKLLLTKAVEFGAGTFLDVGANFGQFAAELRKDGFKGTMVSFEPLSVAHTRLTRAAARDPAWLVPPRMALGDAGGEATINISHNLASSSLLRVEARSVTTAPESGFRGKEPVAVRRLDDVVDPSWPTPFAMKLDTQGFELHVLRGAPATLAKTAVVVVEMSLTPLYEGGAAFVDVYRFFEDNGFRCISLTQGFADHVRHELLQVDGVFVRG